MSLRLRAELRLLASRCAARLALALVLSFTITVLPTVMHTLCTGGPVQAAGAGIELARWILIDLRPNGSF